MAMRLRQALHERLCRRGERGGVAVADDEAALGPGLGQRNQAQSASAWGCATSRGTRLTARPARTTRSAASKLVTITRCCTARPSCAAFRCSMSCTALLTGRLTCS